MVNYSDTDRMVEMSAELVTEGDYLPNLDFGYVYSVDHVHQYGAEPVIELCFHDSNGDECYLTVPTGFPLQVIQSDPV